MTKQEFLELKDWHAASISAREEARAELQAALEELRRALEIKDNLYARAGAFPSLIR